MKPRNLAVLLFLTLIFGFLFFFCVGCANRSGVSSRLQGHIGQAQTASDETSGHIRDFKSTAERIDFKASKANRLLNQGVDRPE